MKTTCTLVLALAAISASTAVTLQSLGTQEVVRAREMLIIGEKGEVCMRLSGDSKGGVLSIMDVRGRAVLTAQVVFGSGYLSILGDGDMATCILSGSHGPAGSKMVLNDRQGNRRVLLSADETKRAGGIAVGNSERTVAGVTCDEDGSGWIYVKSENSSGVIRMNKSIGQFELSSSETGSASSPARR